MTKNQSPNLKIWILGLLQDLQFKNWRMMKSEILMSESTKFIVTILKKLFEKNPAGFNVVKNASIFTPHTLRNEKVVVVQRRLNLLLTHLEKQKILWTAQCNKMTEQILEFINYDLKVNIMKFENFSANDTNLEDFNLMFIRIEKHQELLFLGKIVLTLNHGQAFVECSFSLNKSVLNYNVSEDSIVAKKVIRDHMLSNGLNCNQLVWCVSGACQKYQDYIAQHKDEGKQLKLDQQSQHYWKRLTRLLRNMTS